MLSYARPDQEKVQSVYNALLGAGLRPWMDVHDILPAADYRLEIQKAIRGADVFVACISSHSVNRPGVIQGELKEALDIWEERLDRSGFLIPLRLEPVDLPKSISHLQQVDLFAPDGLQRFLNGVRIGTGARRRRALRIFAIAGALVALAVAAAWIGFGVGHYRRESAAFAQGRPGGSPLDAAASAEARVGLTLWRAGNPSGASCADRDFRRLGLDAKLHAGDALRIGFEANRPGFLYILNREVGSEWYLIYPTLKMRGGANRVEPGVVVEMPPNDSACATFTVEKSRSGDELVFLLAEAPLADLPAREEEYVLPSNIVSRLLSGSSQPARETSSGDSIGRPRSLEEDRASAITDLSGERRLRYNDALPQTILSFDKAAGPPFAGRVALRSVD